ncbi:MAG: phosphatidate cytidylyltransferase [Alphaproteobacteria bacterium]|nr:phosphatidate cytidylyltransferase [Alphaproteobacteria bacterium]
MQISYRSEIERKLLHLSSLWIAAFLYFFPYWPSVILFGSLVIIGIAFEYGYHKRWPFFFPVYKAFFGHILRSAERSAKFSLSGGVYVFVAAFISAVFFTKEVGAIAMSVMLISDTFAGLVGRKFGTHKIVQNKSLEGTVAFVVSGILVVIGLCFVFQTDIAMYIKGCTGIFFAALAELYERKIKIDDNLTIVLIIGILMSF